MGAGAAYVFQRAPDDGDEWNEIAKLIAPNGAVRDRLGADVSIHGNVVAVGADRRDDEGEDAGTTYVYLRHRGGRDGWGLATRASVNGTRTGEELGVGVGVNGTTVVGGAWMADGLEPGAGAAYVFELDPTVACRADLDGSGAVDFGDVLAVLATWGPCPPSCPEDLDGDGAVTFADLLVVLASWGPCG